LRLTIPLAIAVLALAIGTIQQTISLMRARDQLTAALGQQEAPFREAVALRDQLDAIARDTATLAAGGDPAAKAIVDALRQQGIALPPPRQS
jgi:hypothetical protein